MKRTITKFRIALFGLALLTAASAKAQVNTARCITLTVTADDSINLLFIADAANTQIQIVSGTTDTTLTIDTVWTDEINCIAKSTTLQIFGNIEVLNCSENGAKITGLDASHNPLLQSLFCGHDSIRNLNLTGLTQLKTLYCNNTPISHLNVSGLTELIDLHCENTSVNDLNLTGVTKLESLDCSNTFIRDLNVSGLTELRKFACFNTPLVKNTIALDRLYCQLPDHSGETDKRYIFPLEDSTSADKTAVFATNNQNAITKNWNLVYAEDGEIIPTTGTFACESPSGLESVSDNGVSAKVYPNPVSNVLHVECSTAMETVQLCNLAGRVVLTGTTTVLDVSAIANGVYFLKIHTKNGSKTVKVVK